MASSMNSDKAWKYAEERLLQVSRTFALNINVLKGNLHKVILLAYLYLRIADTVEDDPHMKASEKERVLGLFADIFKSSDLPAEKIKIFLEALPKDWKDSEDMSQELSAHADVVVPLLLEFEDKYKTPVCEVVVEMCGGMAKFALRQEQALANGWFTLESVHDLDEYCYYVAGIVGKLLTKLFCADSRAISKEHRSVMERLDVSFGLALQVTNIVKDCVEDSGRNVCFIPEEISRKHGFDHSYDMFKRDYCGDRSAYDKHRAGALKELVDKAWTHLDDAIQYTLQVPRRLPRTRLFCLWPLFMAAANLRLIGDGLPVFESEKKVKITRDTVKQIISKTMLHVYSNRWIEKKFNEMRHN